MGFRAFVGCADLCVSVWVWRVSVCLGHGRSQEHESPGLLASLRLVLGASLERARLWEAGDLCPGVCIQGSVLVGLAQRGSRVCVIV